VIWIGIGIAAGGDVARLCRQTAARHLHVHRRYREPSGVAGGAHQSGWTLHLDHDATQHALGSRVPTTQAVGEVAFKGRPLSPRFSRRSPGSQNDPIVRTMNRQNYISYNWSDESPRPRTAKHKNELPEELQEIYPSIAAKVIAPAYVSSNSSAANLRNLASRPEALG
jgi:hypothetical protein